MEVFIAYNKPQLFWAGLMIILISGSFCRQGYAKIPVSLQEQIAGTVTDAQSGETLPGVNILVKGTSTGASTNAKGQYELTVKNLQATLVVSFVGYKTQEVPINGRTEIDVALQPQAISGEEMVVVGYGKVESRNLTGSVSKVSSEELSNSKVSSNNVLQAIQGEVAGVNVTQNSWSPGAGATVRIRGRRSITASADPLYVIDGIPMTRGSIAINDIDPSNIASIEVLKDASATAIYGSRGANGVILMTTKGGHAGKTTVNYNSYVGFQKPLNPVDVYDGAEYAEYIRESFRNSAARTYNSPVPSIEQDKEINQLTQDPYVLESVLMGYDKNGNYDPSKVRDFDWLDAVRRTGTTQKHNLRISGGTEKTRISASLGYQDNRGILKNQYYDRFNARFNINHEIFKNVTLFASTYVSRINKNIGPDLVGGARDLNPLARPKDDEGNWIVTPGNDPLTLNTLLDIDGITNESQKDRFITNIRLDAKIFKGLEYELRGGYDYRTARDGTFESSQSTARNLQSPTASYGGNRGTNVLLENILTYEKTINENHRITATALQSFQQQNFETYSSAVEGLPYESQLFYNLGTGDQINGVGTELTKWRLSSYMGRINYDLFDKYLFTFTARSDGSSRLASGNKYQLFPSAAFGWRISDENFLHGIDFINRLKLRLSYGQTGNSAINPYQTLGSLKNLRYVWGEQTAIGFAPDNMPNPDLTWETTAQANIGLDFAFFDDRISGSVDAYQQNTSDLLMPRRLPTVTGFENVLTNVGKTRNTGLEINISTVNINHANDGFTWNTDVIFSTNKEEIIEITGGKKDDIGNEWFIGHPINVYYDLDAIGIWQDTEKDKTEMDKFNANGHNFEVGSIRLKDQNGDYKIDAQDRIILGSEEPEWTLGLGNKFYYKNFDLSFQVYVSYGNLAIHDQNLQLNGRYNMVDINYWTPDNPTNRYPKPNFDWLAPPYINTTYYEDASYARLRFISLGYTFTPTVIKETAINNLRVYLTVENPYLLTNYTGPDPVASQGIGITSPKTFKIGISLDL